MTDVLPIRRRGERTPTRGESPHWQFPGSRKVYVNGVGMREISLSPTRLPGGGVEENPPLRVYDTSGPYSDPAIELDVEQGLPRLRETWIRERSGVRYEELEPSYRPVPGHSDAELPLPPRRRVLRVPPRISISYGTPRSKASIRPRPRSLSPRPMDIFDGREHSALRLPCIE